MKRKNILIIGTLFLLGVVLGILFSVVFPSEGTSSSAQVVWKGPMEVEVYELRKISDFVSIENGNLVQDEVIDTTQVGTFTYEFRYTDTSSNEQTDHLTIQVKDTEEPLIGIGKTYSYLRGSSRGLDEIIMCADNYDAHPTCRIEGDYDLDTLGEYDVVYYAVDSSGNEAREPFTLKVVDKYDSTTRETITLEEAKNKYLKNDVTIGIDVSKWQGNIDWDKVKESGVTFAFIRLGTQTGPHQDSTLDSYFKQNVENAKKAGIQVGVYYYTYAGSKEEASTQASWVLEQLKDYELDLPVVFDWECYSYFNSFGVSLHDLNEIADTFLQEVKNNGYQSMLYASKNYLQKVWKYLDYPTWLAHYTENTDYEGDYQYWQFTDHGRIPGIQGNVDFDLGYLKDK